eukprot:scaffold110019_cov32-Tisochrysis_lutea.AAC.6
MKKDDHAAAPLASLERGDAVSEEAVASNLQAAAAQEAQVTPVLEAGAQVAAASQDGRQRKPAKKRSGSGCQSTRARSRGQCSTAMPPSVPAPLFISKEFRQTLASNSNRYKGWLAAYGNESYSSAKQITLLDVDFFSAMLFLNGLHPVPPNIQKAYPEPAL